MHHRRRRTTLVRVQERANVLPVKSALAGVLAVAVLLAGIAATASSVASAQESNTLGQIVERDRLVAAQESLLNTYRCLYDIDTHAVPGGCVDWRPDDGPVLPGEFQGVPTAQEVEVRDKLVVAQESLLNIYRCRFDVDTQLVPGGCRGEEGTPEEGAGRSIPTGNTGRLNGAILTTECNDDRPRDGTLTLGMFGEITSWDPTLSYGSAALGGTQLTALYDALFYLDQTTGRLVPGLAESITTHDNQVFTLTLRDGITFTDGTPLDADAFIWNVEHHQRPEVGSQSRSAALRVASVTKIDDLTLELTSTSVNATFPQLFARELAWMMSPTAYQDGQDPESGLNERIGLNPIGAGAGPFVFEYWIENDQAVLMRNPNYFREGCPYLDRVIFKPVIEPLQRYNLFRAGRLDIAYDRDPANLHDARQRGVNTTSRIDNHGGYWMLNGATEPFNIRECRVAVAHAIDYDTLNEIVWDGLKVMDRSIMGPGSRWLDPNAELPGYDPYLAATALDECDAQLGQQLEFETSCTWSPENMLIAENLVAMWNEASISASANCTELGEMIFMVFAGEPAANPWAVPADDPDHLYDVYFGDSSADGVCGPNVGSRNFSKSCFPEFDAALTQGRQGLTFKERYEGYSRFQRKFAEEVPVILMDKSETGYYWSNEVSGVFMSATGLLLLAHTAIG